jgi:hypothetical protein
MNYNIQLTKIANSSILIVMGMTGAGTIKRFHVATAFKWEIRALLN